MKSGAIIAMLLVVLGVFSGTGRADTIVKGKVILISGIRNDMYTVKTDSHQGFRGSRETFYVDPKSTKKTGEIKVGTEVEAEINPNGTAYWIKALDEANPEPKTQAKKPAGK